MTRALTLSLWCLAVWVLLTWTATAEQAAFGVGIALTVGIALAPLGDVVRPWRLASPRVLWRLIALTGFVVGQIARANATLAWRVWQRRPPLHTGFVIVPTALRSDAGLTAVGLLSSLIVDNQIIDVDRGRHELLYHAVVVPDGGRVTSYHAINARLEDHLLGLAK